MSKHVAIVEDDADVRSLLERSLSVNGYHVTAVANGAEVERILSAAPVDLLILDVGLPDIDGLTIAQQVRRYSDVGIIMISGRGDLADRVVGLEVGADDYVTKPFEPREVLARVRSVLRRGARSTVPVQPMAEVTREVFEFEGWILDRASQTLTDFAGIPKALTTGEYKLLEALVLNPNRVLSRDQLLDLCYGHRAPAFDRSIDVCMVHLRKKLGDDARRPTTIKTVRGCGYIFAPRVVRRLHAAGKPERVQ